MIRPQLEQLLRILPSNLQPIRRVQLRMVKPLTGVFKRLERIIDREENPIRPNLRHAEVQRRGREMSRRRDPYILRKVIPDRLLARLSQPQQLLAILEPVVDAPHVERHMLA